MLESRPVMVIRMLNRVSLMLSLSLFIRAVTSDRVSDAWTSKRTGLPFEKTGIHAQHRKAAIRITINPTAIPIIQRYLLMVLAFFDPLPVFFLGFMAMSNERRHPVLTLRYNKQENILYFLHFLSEKVLLWLKFLHSTQMVLSLH